MMAESRRVSFTTLPCNAPKITVVNKPTSPPQTAMCASASTVLVQADGNPPERPFDPPNPLNPAPTVRHVLTLFEADERSFPEFNYAELQEEQMGYILVKNGTLTGTFVEQPNREEKEVAALAKKYEDAYGGASNRKKDRIQDLVDIGHGYDDGDSFIDNSEAYDEFVPASLTTKLGGFYINSGVLQFRQVSGEESDDFAAERMTPTSPKKRKLKEGGQDKPKKKKRRQVGQMDSNVGALSEPGAEEQMMKKKKKKRRKQQPPGALSITDMLKKFQREKEQEKVKERRALKKAQETRPAVGSPTIHLCPADAGGGGGMGLADPLLSLIGSTNENTWIQAASTVDFDVDLDSLLDAADEDSCEVEVIGDSAGVREPAQRPDQRLSQDQQPQTEGQGGVPQPESLPPPAAEAALTLPKTDSQTWAAAGAASQSQPLAKTKVQQPQQTQTQPQQTQPQQMQTQPQQTQTQPQQMQSQPLAKTKVQQPQQTQTQPQQTQPQQMQTQPQQTQPQQMQTQPQQMQTQPQQTQSQIPSEPKTVSLLQLFPLPEGLPPVLQTRIGELTVSAKDSQGESKLKFFTPEINSILLDIELQCRALGIQVRSKVYTHLTSFLPCSRETLLKRVKKLLNAHITQEPVQKLKEAIGIVMPEQIARYEDTSQTHAQAKNSKVTEEGKEREQRGNTGSEAEEKSGKGCRRKRFKWSEETRECLCHAVRMKMDRYETERTESQDMEEYLKIFLDNEVKPLWPKGWMQPSVKKTTATKAVKTQPHFSGAPGPQSGSSDALASQRRAPSLDKTGHLGGGLGHKPWSLPAVEKDALKMGEAANKHSPLNLLAEQALVRERLLQDSTSQDLFAAGLDPVTDDLQAGLNSPPPPPPPPPSSPVGTPGNRPHHLAGSSVLQAMGLSGLRYGTGMLTASNDGDAAV